MKKNLTYLMLSAILFLIGLFASFLADHPNGHVERIDGSAIETEFLNKPRPQRESERVWSSLSFEKVYTVFSGEHCILHKLTRLRVDSRGFVFVLDTGDLTIKEFTPLGQCLRTIGVDHESSQGKLGPHSDISIDSGGNVWAVDPVSGEVCVWDSTGKFIRDLRLQEGTVRILPFQHTCRVAAIPSPGRYSSGLFQIYDPKLGMIGQFGDVLPHTPKILPVREGFLSSVGDSILIFASFKAGILVAASTDGNTLFFVRTIDRISVPYVTVQSESGGNFHLAFPRDTPVSALSVGVIDKAIFLLSGYSSDLYENQMVIDFYDCYTGEYINSARIPVKCRSIEMNASFLYTLTDTAFTKWKRSIGSL